MPSLTEKLVVDGIGGLTPVAVRFVIADASTIGEYLTNVAHSNTAGIAAILGYVVQLVLLFSVGAFWVYLHRSEPSLLKLFQLGLVAPAMITGMIQAGNINHTRVKLQGAEHVERGSILTTAFAAPKETDRSSSASQKEAQTPLSDSFLRGVLTRPLRDPVGEVIDTLEEVRRDVRDYAGRNTKAEGLLVQVSVELERGNIPEARRTVQQIQGVLAATGGSSDKASLALQESLAALRGPRTLLGRRRVHALDRIPAAARFKDVGAKERRRSSRAEESRQSPRAKRCRSPRVDYLGKSCGSL